ncbi:TRASH domain-containing protein [Acidianus sulfidivorans JP7]|uniref:AsnC family transcriptional regulator n=1 Tax=Acidianus sulfidivorans JP7 TaxID=619593 RepID=A0A2U9IQN3_9CREN|nr:TRASH domain-containing protein [Acidianus sulfidivorans JP7]
MKLSELEYKVLQLLKIDARIPASQIAKQLGLSRVTVSRIILSLKKKGIKFSVNYVEKDLVAIVTTDSCVSEECFKTITGDYISIIRGDSIDEIERNLPSNVKNIVLAHNLGKKITKSALYCDYCGGKIEGEPLLYKKGKKIYYTCCKACLEGLKKKIQFKLDDKKVSQANI